MSEFPYPASPSDNTSLDTFRKEWQEQVRSQQPSPPSTPPLQAAKMADKDDYYEQGNDMSYDIAVAASQAANCDLEPVKSTEMMKKARAIDVYLKAMELEREGLLSEALLHYRRAFKLDRDIDSVYRCMEQDGLSPAAAVAAVMVQQKQQEEVPSLAAEQPIAAPLVVRVMTEACPQGENATISMDADSVSAESLEYTPTVERKPVYILKVPNEVLLHILGHVVEHSASSVAQFALVCKHFFSMTRSTSLWRHACIHAFCTPSMTLAQSYFTQQCHLENYGGSWLKMYQERPRIRYDGVYISMCQYIRPGESDSAWTKPVHLVTYYRYLRFFPDGTVMKYLSTDEPQGVVRLLQPGFARRQVFQGQFTVADEDSRICIEMKDASRPREQFHMELYMKSTRGGKRNKLGWIEYSSSKEGRDESTMYDLRYMRPYVFSLVRSFRA